MIHPTNNQVCDRGSFLELLLVHSCLWEEWISHVNYSDGEETQGNASPGIGLKTVHLSVHENREMS